jgi:GT2 family glycosyltransferase
VDVVVVSFQSRGKLRACIEPLTRMESVHPIVVDNASTDGSLDEVRDLPAQLLPLDTNVGFARGSNAGWRAGRSPYVLFLNPDAHMDESSLQRLVDVLARDDRAGLAAPRIVDDHGGLHLSQRRFARLRSTYAQAVFLHRIAPSAAWSDEIVREPEAYERRGSPEWVSGACMLLRRQTLERLGGFDERFFLYCEDMDLCKRVRALGLDVVFEPAAVAAHEGGASAPRPSVLPLLARSRVQYADKHLSRSGAVAERLGIGLGALSHMVVSRGGRDTRAAHARSLAIALGAAPAAPPSD